ncbi:hypothetical protein, partial [Aeromonas veronii]|uniref:hypothetical protein n=1 Tax=Aeromonas veronii TaxID=654 RepID=UPI003D21BCBF
HGNFCAVGYHNPKREKVSGPMGSNPQTMIATLHNIQLINIFMLGTFQTSAIISLSSIMQEKPKLPPVDYSLQPAAVIRRCGGWRNGCTGLSLQE